MSRRRTIPRALALVVALAALSACSSPPAIIDYQSLPHATWSKDYAVPLLLAPIPATGRYDIALLLRTDRQYPYQQLTTIIEEHIIPTVEQRIDTLTTTVFTPTGSATGGGVSLFQYTAHINTPLLMSGDSLALTIRHGMRDAFLPGVVSIGVSATRH